MRVAVCRFTPHDGGKPFTTIAILRRLDYEVLIALVGPMGVLVDANKGTVDMAGEAKGEFVFDEHLPIRDEDLDVNQP